MGKDASVPQSPDYQSLIPLQTQANKDVFNYALGASRANTVTPYGTGTWTKTPSFDQSGYDAAMAKWNAPSGGQASFEGGMAAPGGGGWGDLASSPAIWGGGAPAARGPAPSREDFTTNDWTYTESLSPEQQQLYNANVSSQLQQSQLLDALTRRVGESTAQPLDYSGLPELAGGSNQSIADALYNKMTRYAEPDWARQRSSLEARLAEQGFVPGTPGYDTAMQGLTKTTDLAKADARDRALLMGMDQSRLQNQARAQGIAELLQKRQFPINELSAIRSGTQVQNPVLSPTYATPGLQAPDILGAANNSYLGQLDAYNASAGASNDLFSNLIGLGGLFLGGPMGAGLAGLFKGMGGAGTITGGSGIRFPGYGG